MKKFVQMVACVAMLSLSASAADIVDTAVGAGSFNTLVAAVKAAGVSQADIDTMMKRNPAQLLGL